MSSVVVAYDAVTKPDYVVAGAAADRAGEGSAIRKKKSSPGPPMNRSSPLFPVTSSRMTER
jgi:hypothetical protein